jgi:hypothetical protein
VDRENGTNFVGPSEYKQLSLWLAHKYHKQRIEISKILGQGNDLDVDGFKSFTRKLETLQDKIGDLEMKEVRVSISNQTRVEITDAELDELKAFNVQKRRYAVKKEEQELRAKLPSKVNKFAEKPVRQAIPDWPDSGQIPMLPSVPRSVPAYLRARYETKMLFATFKMKSDSVTNTEVYFRTYVFRNRYVHKKRDGYYILIHKIIKGTFAKPKDYWVYEKYWPIEVLPNVVERRLSEDAHVVWDDLVIGDEFFLKGVRPYNEISDYNITYNCD